MRGVDPGNHRVVWLRCERARSRRALEGDVEMGARRVGALLLAATLATGLAACGGDDDEGAEDVALEDVDDDSADSDAEDEDADDEADSDDDADEATDVDEDITEGLFGEGCAEFLNVFGALGGAIGGAFDEDAAEQFEQFVDDAPEEIRDDLETVAEGYAEFAAILEDAGLDVENPEGFDPSDGEAVAAFTEASEIFNSSEFVDANTAISEFVDDNCAG